MNLDKFTQKAQEALLQSQGVWSASGAGGGVVVHPAAASAVMAMIRLRISVTSLTESISGAPAFQGRPAAARVTKSTLRRSAIVLHHGGGDNFTAYDHERILMSANMQAAPAQVAPPNPGRSTPPPTVAPCPRHPTAAASATRLP